MANIKIAELQTVNQVEETVNQVEELSNEDLTSVVGGIAAAGTGGLLDSVPVVGPLLGGLLGGLPIVGGIVAPAP
ncbi:hypothetical protein F7734_28875 [Scytonema sp. UIC 10036]|uniref:hypothetical protein n=1 Tax=Scytonema sp. UIC 10036 TaxID=2304196 RepID=UPI0012DA86BE|nr:hypothetical protein [Scytonema sp. UIC 10036]MUG96137.1 hypothetical protein [Scytonema sp. UIC 10036]